MVKVVVNDNKGLVQYSGGGGLHINNLVLGSETVSAAGAASVHVPVSLIDSDGDTMAVTLADGTNVGQIKWFVSMHATAASSVTPDTTDGAYEVFTLTNLGDTVQLLWTGTGWAVIGRNSGAAKPSAVAVVGLPIFA
jgi:hypothetical protein